MKVPRDVKIAFDFVCEYMKLTPVEIQECREEFIRDPAWGLEFYIKAAAVIRAAQGVNSNDRSTQS